MLPVQRVAVVGSSGAGKTRAAKQLARILGVPHVEMDAIHHQPGWEPLPAEEMRRELDVRCPELGAWVADGGYEGKGGDLVRARADTVVWLDLPRTTVARQLLWRTARRVLRREELWNGNRETLRAVLSLDPERSILAWGWTHHEADRRRLEGQRDRRWVRLTGRAAVRRFLAETGRAQAAGDQDR